MHIRRHNLISLSFISQRSAEREDTRIIAFMFCFPRRAEQITTARLTLDAFRKILGHHQLVNHPGGKSAQLENVWAGVAGR